MDWAFFENLTRTEAESFLENFLRESSNGFNGMVPELERGGVHPDFSIESNPELFGWLASRLKTLPKEPDESLPEWLRRSESYTKYLFDFDERSRIYILRVAYYFGESFNRVSDKLSWATGNRTTAQQNMPVITGFKKNMELAPIAMSEGLCKGFAAGTRSILDVEVAIKEWCSLMPN